MSAQQQIAQQIKAYLLKQNTKLNKVLAESPYIFLVFCFLGIQSFFLYQVRADFTLLSRFYDGPNFLIVAKSFYRLTLEDLQTYKLALASYFPSHLPLYPLLVRLMSFFSGWLWALPATTALTTLYALLLFYKVLVEYDYAKDPLLTSILFLVFPMRWNIYHVFGATEPLFMGLIFASLLFWKSKRYFWLGVTILLLSLTKLVGVTIGLSYLLLALRTKAHRSIVWICLSSLGLIGYFFYCYSIFGNWTTPLNVNLNHERHLRWPPFNVLASHLVLEDFRISESYFWQYSMYLIGIFMIRKHKEIFYICVPFAIFMCFEYHMDVTRYLLPLAPFALVIGYGNYLSKLAKIVVICFLTSLGSLYIKFWPETNAYSSEKFMLLLDFLEKK